MTKHKHSNKLSNKIATNTKWESTSFQSAETQNSNKSETRNSKNVVGFEPSFTLQFNEIQWNREKKCFQQNNCHLKICVFRLKSRLRNIEVYVILKKKSWVFRKSSRKPSFSQNLPSGGVMLFFLSVILFFTLWYLKTYVYLYNIGFTLPFEKKR